jgi:hypothetical protein
MRSPGPPQALSANWMQFRRAHALESSPELRVRLAAPNIAQRFDSHITEPKILVALAARGDHPIGANSDRVPSPPASLAACDEFGGVPVSDAIGWYVVFIVDKLKCIEPEMTVLFQKPPGFRVCCARRQQISTQFGAASFAVGLSPERLPRHCTALGGSCRPPGIGDRFPRMLRPERHRSCRPQISPVASLFRCTDSLKNCWGKETAMFLD